MYQEDQEPISKTRRKQEMQDLQDLGAALVRLSKDQLKQLDLPEKLLEAVKEAQRLTAHGAIRRQLQFIGKIMREVDPAPIQAFLDRLSGESSEHTAWLHQLERLRDKLLASDEALQALLAQHPALDIQQMRTMVRNARKEREENKPPKHFRALFQTLRELIPEPSLPGRAKSAPQSDQEDDA
ncbi:ribosome-associated protein [Chitinivorax tropicus]|uniref:Dual-action ribosomal maturation protein DarP n=1 Tax=Chitinivorax tropicus TaxID=714531 RepID=A0A840MX24_9PROT|nr:ribosome biogenesis factor YjgA [Chitinivorax tropicus]MBB5019701.1 ribosome-associated protein [Chitinivorax tropicus]